MAITQNTFEGGTSGAAITTGNSGGGSGTAFDAVNGTAPANLTYSTTAANGSRGANIASTGTSSFLIWYTPSTTKLSLRFYIRLASLPSAEFQAVTPRSSSNYVSALNITTAGKLKLTSANPGTPTLFTATNALALNTWYRVEVSWEIGTTTGNGKAQFKYFAGDSTTAVESFTTTTANLGTLPVEELRAGKLGATGNVNMFYDSIAYDPTTVTLLGPWVAINNAPVADAGTGATNVEPGTVLTLNGSGSADSDGSIVSYLWEQTDGPTVALSGTGHSRTFTAPYRLTSSAMTFRLTVTDNTGATAAANVSFTILRCTERIVIGGVERPLAIYTVTE